MKMSFFRGSFALRLEVSLASLLERYVMNKIFVRAEYQITLLWPNVCHRCNVMWTGDRVRMFGLRATAWMKSFEFRSRPSEIQQRIHESCRDNYDQHG